MERNKENQIKEGKVDKGLAMEKDVVKDMEEEVFSIGTTNREEAVAKEERRAEREAFRRKPTLARTPPQRRALSLPGEDEETRYWQKGKEAMDEEKAKRKRGEDSSPPTTGKEVKKPREVRAELPLYSQQKGSEAVAAQIRAVIGKMRTEIRTVVEVAKERNTKKEVKEAAAKLNGVTAQLTCTEGP